MENIVITKCKTIMRKGSFMAFFLLLGCSTISPSPDIVAHRAGTADAPENTYVAIDTSLKNNVDAQWITVQPTINYKFVLYRPSDLSALTNMTGKISSYTLEQLSTANAATQFNQKNGTHYNIPDAAIPSLAETLLRYPTTQFYIDLKSPDADPALQAEAILTLLNETNAFSRTRFYSTNDDFIDALRAVSDKINVFESRDETRSMLANSLMAQTCSVNKTNVPSSTAKTRWYGFELRRKVEVVERYTLGEARSDATLVWDKSAIDCFKNNNNAYIILFGVNTIEDYQLAKELGANAVMVDSPKLFSDYKKSTSK